MHLNNSPVNILLVEDNPGDVRLTREALKESELECDIHVVRDGVEALDFLRRNGKYVEAKLPDLIILDWNLPKKNGMEVLRDIKADEILRRIPVIILTSSESERDIKTAYSNYANCYITKPIDHNDYSEAIKSIQSFWVTIAKLPALSV